MKELACAWCENNASHHAVFGSLTTMRIWSLRLCRQHKELCEININVNPVYAPINPGERSYESSWADIMETRPL